ncbi:general secretion pathway protein GspK [Rhodopseudomonas sp. NSM]|uniref:general secretion pathway protein GspK n=1 Tax=Rhodopseudomonas sp. NSM TaxID=3457630 RepID=UPI0040357731
MPTAARSTKAPRTAHDGFIVVAALWLLAALAALAVTASQYIAQSATALSLSDDALQSELLAMAGLEMAAYRLSAPAGPRRPTHGSFRFSLARSEVEVEFLSEASRINLNMAPKAMIAGLFAALGTPASLAERYADRVVGWRSPRKSAGPDEEDALYSAVGYPPRRSPFNSSDELWLVLGLPPALVERALPFVTVYSEMEDVNVLDAPPEVIAALPGVTPLLLDAFLTRRDSTPVDPQFLLGMLGERRVGATLNSGSAYRVRVRVTTAGRQQKISEAAVLVSGFGDQNAYRVMSWRDIDPGTGHPAHPAVAR